MKEMAKNKRKQIRKKAKGRKGASGLFKARVRNEAILRKYHIPIGKPNTKKQMEALEELGEQLRSYETSSWDDARCKVRAEREAAGKPHIAHLADDDEFCQQVIKKKEELTKVIFQA